MVSFGLGVVLEVGIFAPFSRIAVGLEAGLLLYYFVMPYQCVFFPPPGIGCLLCLLTLAKQEIA